jgi:FkbM family methyltransferase
LKTLPTLSPSRLAAAYVARGISFFYRLNHLRLAKVVFLGVDSPAFVRRRFFGHSLIIDVGRANPQKLLWLQGERFVKERDVLSRVTKPGMTVIDIGANIGYYTLLFSSLVSDGGKVIALEPDSTNLRELQINVSHNELNSIVSIIPIGASDHDGVDRFEPGLNSHITPSGSQQVSVMKLDSILKTKVDLIKIDVEGYEGAVLDGAVETIERSRPVILLELHPNLLTTHTHRQIAEGLQRNYRHLNVYQIERQSPWRRLLQGYGFLREYTEADDLPRLLEDYENRRLYHPCWLLARP